MKIKGYVIMANARELEGQNSEGIDFVDDMNMITYRYGIETTVASNREFIEIEAYRVFFPEQS